MPRPDVDDGLSPPFVAVMGPVHVEGWAAGAPRRTAVVDLIVFLACHPDRPVSTDRLRTALSGPAGEQDTHFHRGWDPRRPSRWSGPKPVRAAPSGTRR